MRNAVLGPDPCVTTDVVPRGLTPRHPTAPGAAMRRVTQPGREGGTSAAGEVGPVGSIIAGGPWNGPVSI